MDISTLTIEQLKALIEQLKASGYDQFLLIQQAQVNIQQAQTNIQQTQNNLNLVQAEIEKRKGQQSEVKPTNEIT